MQHPARNITFVKRNPHSHTVVSSVTFLNHLFPHLKKSLPFWSHPCPETGLCLPSFCILCICPLICLLINHFCWFLLVHLNTLLLSAWTTATQLVHFRVCISLLKDLSWLSISYKTTLISPKFLNGANGWYLCMLLCLLPLTSTLCLSLDLRAA